MSEKDDYLSRINVTNMLIKGPISFVILGAWDSKLGPVVENLWYARQANTDSLDNLSEEPEVFISNDDNHFDYINPNKANMSFILSTMLNGGEEPSLLDESSKSTLFCHPSEEVEVDKCIKVKIMMMEKYSMIIHSFLFTAAHIIDDLAKPDSSIIPHCLTYVFSLKIKDKYNKWSSLINDFTKKYLLYFRISHKKSQRDSLITDYTSIITFLICILCRLDSFALGRNICFKKTFFSTSNIIYGERIKREFLSTAIMSHLMTFGRSLVIGTDINLINMMIRTLAVFLPEDKRELCLELREDEQFFFSSQIMVQGFCRDNFVDVDYTPWSVISGPYPLTVIILNLERVLQSGNYIQHLWMQNIMHQKLLTKFYFLDNFQPIGLFLKNINIKLEFILKDGCYLGDLCKTLVTKIMNVSGCRKKSDIFHFFQESLLHKAKLLILLTQQHSRYRKNILGGEWKVSKSHLREACQLKKEGDFLIVLALAEQLSSGIYGILSECSNENISDINILFNQI